MTPQATFPVEAPGTERGLDLLRLHAADPDRFPFLLESVAHGTVQSRHDLLFTSPGESLVLNPGGTLEGPFAEEGSFLGALDAWWRSEKSEDAETTAPFNDGWFLYLGYELAGEIEPRLSLPGHPGRFPVAFATRCRGAWIRDHATGKLSPVGAAGPGDLEQATPLPPLEPPAWRQISEDPPGRYTDSVERILDYILAGDVFQVNIARAWRAVAQGRVDPVALYRLLRRTNPAPFAGIARFRGSSVVSSSPERLVAVRGDHAETRPIAGTRPRGSRTEDRRLSDELMRHPKEQAEHIMLIDLERNDLGRVCRPGSIRVDELMVLETYAHVHHIVSNVRGELRDGASPGDVIRAVFPGGTITGCPKVRCMEIIAELEEEGRGPYTGAMGYLDRSGDMDLNILIRSLLAEEDTVTLRAGAGIVADSEPDKELVETRHKAKGLLLALGGEGR